MRGAGAGRPRKPEGTTRHRNKPTRADIVISSRPGEAPRPAFPISDVGMDIWARVWAEPIAVLWSVADVAPLTRLVVLQGTTSALADCRLLAEMRQLEDRFFLNPYSRVQQRVRFADDDDVDEGRAGVGEAGVSEIDAWRARIDGTG
jgi:hypothetical protein